MAGGAAGKCNPGLVMTNIRPLFSSVRSHGGALLADVDDPAAELLAMVWGPRFDREHAHQLARTVAHNRPALDHALAQAADTFDHLPQPRQQRLRQFIRHHASGTIRA